jgi:hypothetical protein
MSRAIKASIQQLKVHVFAAKSRVEKILKGGGSPGTRAAPAQMGKHDADIGVRLDYGDRITRDGIEYQRYKLQANKQAANATIKAIAAKNSHQVLAEVDVPVNPAPEKADETLENMFEHLENNITYKM